MPYLSGGVCLVVIMRWHVMDDVMCRIYYAPLGLGGVIIVAFYHGLQPWLFYAAPLGLVRGNHPG